MYLKNLSLRGFKTFADRTVIEFNPPGSVTAIVGPNGCGKSNLVDAIRWVLGEQNPKELRSAALEEVIFVGSSARKSLSLAEVSIELDNSDNKIKTEFSELCVKRRTFRSGESEFFINKANCRLKDIRDLFLDTGLGAGSYSIISQGQVDAILSSKPEDRREIFEEAAKINKYKFRKTAAERKLISTEQNMLRIADLKSEISNQLSVLEEQAKKASQFKELKDKLKVLEVGLSKRQIKNINDKRSAINERISALRSQMELGLNLTQQYENERASKKELLRHISDDIEAIRLAISQCKLSCEENKSSLLLEKERQKHLEERLNEAQAQHENLSGKLDQLKAKEKELEALLADMESEVKRSEKELRGVESGFEHARNVHDGLEKELGSLKTAAIEAEGRLAEERNRLIELESNLRLAREEEKRDCALLTKLENESEELSKRVASLRSRTESINERLGRKETPSAASASTETLRISFGSSHGPFKGMFKGPSLEIGAEIVYGSEIGIRSVTLGNDLAFTDGKITGGSLKEKIRDAIEKQREIETLIEKARVSQDLEAKELELKNLIEEIALTKRSIQARKKEIGDIASQKDAREVGISHLKDENDSLDKKVADINEKAGASIADKERHLSELAEKKALHAANSSKFESIGSEKDKVRLDMDSIREYLGAMNREELQAKLAEAAANIEAYVRSLPKFAEEEKELGRKLEATLKNRTKAEAELEEVEKKLSGGTSDERFVRDALSKEEVAMAKLDGELAAIAEKMMNEYSMSVIDVEASDVEIPPPTRSKEEAEYFRRAVADLGPVNLLATEEFEKAKERFVFIETQFNDLVMARENLSALIKELDAKAREDFLETMKIINKNFSDIFATLFEGGEARIELSEGADVLSGGVEIVAKPGGKRWLNLSVMSGGERALTAIALLFALLKTHPSPFCLLDEADAALDEANIHRYTKLLKEFSQTTQVVLITHNKQTMEIADIMYGITMEEPGVSKVVSVKLAKAA